MGSTGVGTTERVAAHVLAQVRDVDDSLSRDCALARVRERMFAIGTATRLGRYELGPAIGRGGMGIVLSAHDPQLRRDVAIKLVRGGATAARQARLLREANALARLSHPNVVEVYDVGVASAVGEEAVVYLVMERVAGEDLAAYTRRVRPPGAERLALLLQAGHGLLAAHRAGILHRDFKPGNVLVGRDGRVRVVDFGLAAIAEPLDSIESGTRLGSGDAHLTQTGTVVGTPAYMAPEQHGEGPIDARADQYAFCLAVWEACTGTRPFAGDSIADLLAAKRRGPAPGTALPRALQRVLRRGLAPDPAYRFASLEPVLAALQRAIAPRRPLAAGVALGTACLAGALALALADAGPHPPSANAGVEAVAIDSDREDAIRGDMQHAVELARERRIDEAVAAAERAVVAAQALDDEVLVAEARMARASVRVHAFDEAGAREDYEAAYFALVRLGEERLAAQAAVAMLGHAQLGKCDLDAVRTWTRHAETAIDRLVDPGDSQARLDYSLGTALVTCRQADEAIDRLELAIVGFREQRIDDPVLLSALGRLAQVEIESGRLADGIGHLQELLAEAPAFGTAGDGTVMIAMDLLGYAASVSGDLFSSLSYYDQAFQARAQRGDPAAAVVLVNMGGALLDAGDTNTAIEVLGDACERLRTRPLPDPGVRAQALQQLGRAYNAQQRWAQSHAVLVEALPIAEASDPRGRFAIRTRIDLGWAACGIGRTDEGRLHLRTALDLLENDPSPEATADAAAGLEHCN